MIGWGIGQTLQTTKGCSFLSASHRDALKFLAETAPDFDRNNARINCGKNMAIAATAACYGFAPIATAVGAFRTFNNTG